jgi:hypothetical protein
MNKKIQDTAKFDDAISFLNSALKVLSRTDITFNELQNAATQAQQAATTLNQMAAVEYYKTYK